MTEGFASIPFWPASEIPDPEVLEAFVELIDSLRTLQDNVSGSHPDVAAAKAATASIRAANAVLEDFLVPESRQIAGRQVELPGRAQALVPPIFYDLTSAERFAGRVTFSRFYLGANGAVHGGVIPILFDEFLGRLAGVGRPRARTAFLHVNFRAITPLDRELQLTAEVDRVEGRKIFVHGELRDGETLLCDGEGLFVTLLPGQP